MSNRIPSIIDAVNIDHAMEFSYSGHHVDGIDYLCILRSKYLTFKVYFFDNGCDGSIVIPHTHRYDFDTTVLYGSLEENRYTKYDTSESHNVTEYSYNTPLDGGNGFTRMFNSFLFLSSTTRYMPGQTYSNKAHKDIHTLQNVDKGTIILLTQYADVGLPTTKAWLPLGASVPSTEGMYRKMDRQTVLDRLEHLECILRFDGGQ